MTTRATAANPDRPIVGITLTTGYTCKPKVTFAIDPAVGQVQRRADVALAITDRLTTEADIADGRVIAGTGTIDAEGTVGAIGGVQEKIAAIPRRRDSLPAAQAQLCRRRLGAPACGWCRWTPSAERSSRCRR